LTAEKIVLSRNAKGADIESAHLFYEISPRSGDMRYIVTEQFEKYIIQLIDDSAEMVSNIGFDLATSSRRPLLLRHLLFTGKYSRFPGMSRDISEDIAPSDWIGWWKDAPSDEVRRSLLYVVNNIPDITIEECAIQCLENPKLKSGAVYALGRVGSSHCLPDLRLILNETDAGDTANWGLLNHLTVALGELHDLDSVELLENVVRTDKIYVRDFALDRLAMLGSKAAENALLRLSNEIDPGVDFPEDLAKALFAHGSSQCVAKLLERAKQRPKGSVWLANCMSHAFMSRGWTVGEYYVHVHDHDIVEFMMSGASAMEPEGKRRIVSAVQQIDSKDVRCMLRQIASCGGTDRETLIPTQIGKEQRTLKLSDLAYEELIHRGDESALPYFISGALESNRISFSYKLEQIAKFTSEAVIAEVKNRLKVTPKNPIHIARLLSVLGNFGKPEHASLINPYLVYSNEFVQNVAYESKVRLIDPLRLARNWQEITIEL
jgi:hypothetical protein